MDLVVSTPSGRLRGDELPGLARFRGVPYGASTAGAGRLRAPRPAPSWQGERAALEPGATAPQVLGLMRDLPPQSEDCLTLNVWTPDVHGRRPVMVFLHGGGFTGGSCMHPMYDASGLARRGDVVVVSLNYRLGLLGFADLAALEPGRFDSNVGLRDQLLGLTWVQRHVECFGGDPDLVTVFGQSAGAMSVATLLASPAARGLFARAVAQSGAGHHTLARDESARLAELALSRLGLSAREDAALRRLPLEPLLQAQTAITAGWVRAGVEGKPLWSASMTILPSIDGELLAVSPVDAAARGAGAQVPLLLGTNRDEWDFWLFLSDPRKRELDEGALLKVLERRVPGAGARAAALYAQTLPDAPIYRRYGSFETDRVFVMPARRLAQRRAEAGAKTFLYELDWRSPLFDGEMGASHTMDVPFVLGEVDDGFGKLFTGGGAVARALSQRIMDAWVAFARTGDPSTEALGAWPTFDPAAPQRMQLSRECVVAAWPEDGRVRFWDPLC